MRLRLFLLLGVVAGRNIPARADAIASAQHHAEEAYLQKTNIACGTQITLSFDGDSLRKYDEYLAHGQTDGEDECNEPLRYLYTACQMPAGVASVKAARIRKIACVGMPGDVGALTFANGTITLARVHAERGAFLRTRKEFESLFKMKLDLKTANPYEDQAWRELGRAPNPVTSTTTYCVVNGKKVAFDANLYDPFVYRKENATVKCAKDGVTIVDLTINRGKKTGVVTHVRDAHAQRIEYRDDKEDGETRSTEAGKLVRQARYAAGEQLWEKTFLPSGKLKEYSRRLKSGYARITLDEDGKVYSLSCSPDLRDDETLKKWCGFQGAVTTQIYDGTHKVSRVVTFKDGVLQKEGAGDSAYAMRSDVAYVDGKKNGEERVLGKKGQLASTITWKKGVRDGKERAYSDDGKKLVKEVVWADGVVKESTELYLNGNPKLREIFDGDKKMHRTEYFDIGKVQSEGDFLRCAERAYGYRRDNWCEEGVHKSWYENGTHASETSFKAGKREGTSKEWFDTGKPAAVEEYAGDKLTKAKRWDENGVVKVDEEYEPDGSRKLKR